MTCALKRPGHWPPWSKASSPTAPYTPLHLRILVHLSGFDTLSRELLVSAHLQVSLVFLRSTDIGLVMSLVRKNIVGFPAFLDHGYLARRKVLELLLLRGCLGCDHLKAGCY